MVLEVEAAASISVAVVVALPTVLVGLMADVLLVIAVLVVLVPAADMDASSSLV
jgi:hypothetical protein